MVEHGQRTASCDTSLVVSGGFLREKTTKVFMTRSLDVTPKDNRTAHLTARSDKSIYYVTNNIRLYSTFCTVEAITIDRHEASRGLFATAELLVKMATVRHFGY